MAGTSTAFTTGFFSTFYFFAAGALAGAAFFAYLFGAALVYAVLPFDLLLAGDFDFFPFSSDFPFLVSFFAPLAGVLEGFSGLPVFLSVDFEAFVYFAGLTSFLSEALAFLGLLASSAFNLAV